MIAMSLLLLVLLLSSCTPAGQNTYSNPQMWFETGTKVNPSLADVFYVLPTCIHDWTDSDGVLHRNADPLDSLQRQRMQASFELAESIFADSANFFAPYYPQVSLEVYGDGDAAVREFFPRSRDGAAEAFAYYMKHLNGGRPFVLAGYSQGAQVVLELLESLSDKQKQQLVAAYVIGARVPSGHMLPEGKLIPARGADDTGVVISYSSVSDTATHGRFFDCSQVVINPAGWTTDTTTVALNDSVSVQIVPERNLLLVSGAADSFNPRYESFIPRGSLHLQELTLYSDQLRSNVKARIRNFPAGHSETGILLRLRGKM